MVSTKRGLKYLIGLGTLTLLYTFLQIQHQERRKEIVSKYIHKLSANSKWDTVESTHTKDVSHSVLPVETSEVARVPLPKSQEPNRVSDSSPYSGVELRS